MPAGGSRPPHQARTFERDFQPRYLRKLGVPRSSFESAVSARILRDEPLTPCRRRHRATRICVKHFQRGQASCLTLGEQTSGSNQRAQSRTMPRLGQKKCRRGSWITRPRRKAKWWAFEGRPEAWSYRRHRRFRSAAGSGPLPARGRHPRCGFATCKPHQSLPRPSSSH